MATELPPGIVAARHLLRSGDAFVTGALGHALRGAIRRFADCS